MKSLAVAGALTAATLLTASAAAAPGATTLKLTEVTTFEKLVVDSPPLQRSKTQPLNAGDVLVARSKLLDGAKVAGRGDFFAVVTGFPRAEFYGTFTLPGGTVSIVALGNLAANAQTYAIVGGTGRYTGARGTDHEQKIAEGKTTDIFTITT
jgi:hypothetical protein